MVNGLFKTGNLVRAYWSKSCRKLYHDFDMRKHLILARTTGFGKSVIMKSLITSLILQKPDDVEFSLIDLTGGPAFARFKN
ncbi:MULTISPECIES: FtsK/SpoIIIE domain-containing protein [Heyndrickxia]|uniref:FtsK/SpoIIIE domain-containing protein n=1 Tax=Heyndrickxia TaxID=2837504 RepID=UPI00037E1BCE|nr:hypothetical protein P421_11295 [Heyndrickxia coagulans P38]MBF8417299.1 hypothetical protein [Heyndrickxia coagulans]